MSFVSRSVRALFQSEATPRGLVWCLIVVGSASCGTILGNDFTFESGPEKTSSSGSTGGSTTGPSSSGNTGGEAATASGPSGGGGNGGASTAANGGGGATGGGGNIGVGGDGQGGGPASSSSTGGMCTDASQCQNLTTQCAKGVCDMQQKVCRTTNLTVESPCQGGVCDGNGNCVECVAQADCTAMGMSSACIMDKCIPPSCSDGIQDGNETDVDCGGGNNGNCPKCADMKHCMQNGNCVSNLCQNLTCVDSCNDMTKDGNETDVDCGGAQCAKCASGKKCSMSSDCVSGSCLVGQCGP